jgi:hypothetical protein
MRTISIVFVLVSRPIGSGFIASFLATWWQRRFQRFGTARGRTWTPCRSEQSSTHLRSPP